jgi:hypothetical protein
VSRLARNDTHRAPTLCCTLHATSPQAAQALLREEMSHLAGLSRVLPVRLDRRGGSVTVSCSLLLG